MQMENAPHRAFSSARPHLDRLFDEGLEKFPASDAVTIDFEGDSEDGEARILDSRTPVAGNRKTACGLHEIIHFYMGLSALRGDEK